MAKKSNSFWIWIIIAILIIIAVAAYFIMKSSETQQSPQFGPNEVSCNGISQPAGLTCAGCPAEKPFLTNSGCSPSPTA